jgi:hypothetical protein
VGLHPDPEFRGIAASRLFFAPPKKLDELIEGLSLQRAPRDLPALRRQGHDMPTRRFAEPPLSPTGPPRGVSRDAVRFDRPDRERFRRSSQSEPGWKRHSMIAVRSVVPQLSSGSMHFF